MFPRSQVTSNNWKANLSLFSLVNTSQFHALFMSFNLFIKCIFIPRFVKFLYDVLWHIVDHIDPKISIHAVSTQIRKLSKIYRCKTQDVVKKGGLFIIKYISPSILNLDAICKPLSLAPLGHLQQLASKNLLVSIRDYPACAQNFIITQCSKTYIAVFLTQFQNVDRPCSTVIKWPEILQLFELKLSQNDIFQFL